MLQIQPGRHAASGWLQRLRRQGLVVARTHTLTVQCWAQERALVLLQNLCRCVPAEAVPAPQGATMAALLVEIAQRHMPTAHAERASSDPWAGADVSSCAQAQAAPALSIAVSP